MRKASRKNIIYSGLSWLWLAVVVIALDRYSKHWVLENLVLFDPFKVFSFFNLTLAYNAGASFSFLNSASGWQHWLLGGLAVVVSATIIVWLSRLPIRAYWMNIALCLILAGALSNACDRVLYSHVIDFLDFHLGEWHFAIFNIADSSICVGVFMLIVDWMRHSEDNV